MLRKTMVVLVLLAGLAVPAVRGEEPRYSEFGFGAIRDWVAGYPSWPESEKLQYVARVMEGVWGAFQMSGRYWSSDFGFKGCKIEPPAVLAYTRRSVAGRDLVYEGYRELCEGSQFTIRRGQGIVPLTYADYQRWPESQQARYVDTVMIGIEEAFSATQLFREDSAAVAFTRCRVAEPELSVVLAQLAGAQSETASATGTMIAARRMLRATFGQAPRMEDGKRPMAKLIFIAYEVACREQLTKRLVLPVLDAVGGISARVFRQMSRPLEGVYTLGVIGAVFTMNGLDEGVFSPEERWMLDGCVMSDLVEAKVRHLLDGAEDPHPVGRVTAVAVVKYCEDQNNLPAESRSWAPPGSEAQWGMPAKTFREWDELLKVFYVAGAIDTVAGIVAARGKLIAPDGRKSLEGCAVPPRAVLAALRPLLSAAPDQRPMGLVVLTAIVDACRKQKGK